MSEQLLLSYYGDDLTGSTDVMEALASRGIPTVLFVREPTPTQRARFQDAKVIGLAGTSRSETPAWMEAHLRPALAWLRSLDAAVCHYKVCSTFDSSPRIGSIGTAIDIGADVFGQQAVPLVVGAPQLKRYTAFGTLFAAFRGEIHRIDRHPVMSRHPVTPMREADLRLHLADQTDRRIALVDRTVLVGADPSAAVDGALATAPGALLLDVDDTLTQAEVGRQLWRLQTAGLRFLVGSSGVEYALVPEWVRLGLCPGSADFAPLGPVDRLAVVSGSCSPTTEAQIRSALADGFDGVALDPRRLIGEGRADAIAAAVAEGVHSLRQGRSVILYTALGPASDLGDALGNSDRGRHEIGRALGRILRGLVLDQALPRVVVAGGDTSSHALQELEIFALTTRRPLPASPGSPVCTSHSENPSFDRLEILFKGGQIGSDAFFSDIRGGRS